LLKKKTCCLLGNITNIKKDKRKIKYFKINILNENNVEEDNNLKKYKLKKKK
jgi:hypothetical protein